MKRIPIAALFLAALAAGCAHGRNLVEEGAVSIEINPNRGIHIASASAVQVEEEFRLSGWVKRPVSYSGFSTGHVHVKIMNRQGDIIIDKPVKYTPNRITPRGSRLAAFHEKFDFEPEKGSKVILNRHRAVCQRQIQLSQFSRKEGGGSSAY